MQNKKSNSTVIELLDLIDEYGERLIIEPYIRKSDTTKRVQLYLDSDTFETRDLIEKIDLKIDLPVENLTNFFKTALNALESVESKNMILTEKEIKMIQTSRQGANIQVTWFDQSKEEAEKKVKSFGKTYYKESNSASKLFNTKWITTNKDGFDAFIVTAFYK